MTLSKKFTVAGTGAKGRRGSRYGREVLRQNTAGARNRRGGLSFPPDRMKPNFMKGRYGSMTPGFEIALAIGLVVGFALGYGARALISYRRHQAARRRHLF
jgi:hypothetical protein